MDGSGYIGVERSNEARAAKHSAARIKKSIPKEWASAVDALARGSAGEAFWRANKEWLARLDSFKAAHGNAIACNMGDFEISEKAKETAASVTELLSKFASIERLNQEDQEQAQVRTVRDLCAAMGVAAPLGKTAQGVIARAECHLWWRRALRKKVARVLEHGAISLGFVHKNAGAYASASAVARRISQLARNAAMMQKTLIRNEAGQVFTLQKIADSSVANRDIRRGELMTRIRGCEEYAQQNQHVGVFLTLTCPSRYHAMTAPRGGRGRVTKNPKYDGSTPRDAQAWLRKMWARARAKLARQNVLMYGFRVAEPHHDGCPHWHALLFFADAAAAAAATDVIRGYWLSDAGAERGAAANRVNAKIMQCGGAAGYIAKYVAKNIGGAIDIGAHMDGTGGVQADAFAVDTGVVQGYQRVDAWAAAWGIRQFQSIGQPPVSVWRELRRVTQDQIDGARLSGESTPWRVWGAVHKDGTDRADWCRFMTHMGGAACKRGAWALKTATRNNAKTNDYGESLQIKKVVGVETSSGRWLVSRRQLWTRVTDDERADVVAAADVVGPAQLAPWTRFNNCTARLTNTLRRGFLGRGRHEQSDWQNAAGEREWRRETQKMREIDEKRAMQ